MIKANTIQQRFLLFVLSVSMLGLLASAGFVLYHFDHYNTALKELHAIEKQSKKIVYYDEVLTNSARMYAYKADDVWLTRYQNAAIELDKVLSRLSESDQSLNGLLHETSLLNDQLIKIESKAISLIQSGQADAAQKLLLSADYELLKNDYASQMKLAFSDINLRHEAHREEHESWYQLILFSILLQALIFVAIWFYMLYFMHRNNKRLNHLILTDELTGLHNRRQFDQQYHHLLQRSLQTEQTLALVMLDVDHFKKYNDLYGHPQGDNVLTVLGVVLKKIAEKHQFSVFRLGGEEFAVLALVDEHSEADYWVAQLLKGVENKQISHEGNLPYGVVTVSAGISFQEAGQLKAESKLYSEADIALYRAKSSGRNCKVIFQKETEFSSQVL